jgi:hypothetical protein
MATEQSSGARLARILSSTADVLRAEFKRSADALDHKGLRGTAREVNLLRGFLGTYFPPQFCYATGEVIAADGSRSGQQDIIIYHGTRTPVLYQTESIALVPVEGVLATIEVKTRLDGQELAKACEQVASCKRLKRIAYEDQHLTVEVKGGRPPSPILGLVFAYDSISLDELHTQLRARPENDGAELDGAFVLDKGNLLPFALGSEQPQPWRARGTELRMDSTSPLLRLYTLLWQALMKAWTPPIRVNDYFKT